MIAEERPDIEPESARSSGGGVHITKLVIN
jgi:hypothetical protein